MQTMQTMTQTPRDREHPDSRVTSKWLFVAAQALARRSRDLEAQADRKADRGASLALRAMAQLTMRQALLAAEWSDRISRGWRPDGETVATLAEFVNGCREAAGLTQPGPLHRCMGY